VSATEVPEMEPSELKERIDNEQPLVLLDVREPFEAQIADLPEHNTRRIPTGQLPSCVSDLDPDDTYVVYCRSGARSAWAVQLLMREGFENVLNLKGGVLGWRQDVDPSLQAY